MELHSAINGASFGPAVAALGIPLIGILQDLPGHLQTWTAQMGNGTYVLLFLIIFAETGLILLPFLPGDSLLFAVGALSTDTLGGVPNIGIVCLSLIFAAVLGDAVNYAVGRRLGVRLFQNPKSKIFNLKHLQKTEAFYAKHGGKAVFLARFMPIIRTYVPFVAGVARMNYRHFALYNLIGGCAWIVLFLFAGRWFGNLPQIKTNFHFVILAIAVISFLPAVIEFARSRRQESQP